MPSPSANKCSSFLVNQKLNLLVLLLGMALSPPCIIQWQELEWFQELAREGDVSEPCREKCKFVLLANAVPSSELQDLPSLTTGSGFAGRSARAKASERRVVTNSDGRRAK